MKLNFIIIKIFFFIIFFQSFHLHSIEVRGVICGEGDISSSHKKILNQFMIDNEDIDVTLEKFPWQTCEEEIIRLSLEGNPVSFAYIASRTLKYLEDKGWGITVNTFDELTSKIKNISKDITENKLNLPNIPIGNQSISKELYEQIN